MKLTPFLLLGLNVLVALAGVTPETNDILIEQIYNSVIVGDYDDAVSKTIKLEQDHKGHAITGIVDRLINEGKRNAVEYAYQLWHHEGKDIVKLYFPIQFRLLLGESFVKFINKRDGFALKLGWGTDSLNDRRAYGTANSNSERLTWKFIPLWDNNRVYFKIVNTKQSQYLKLETDTDSVGEHKGWGSDNADTRRHQWYLQPVKYEKELLFFIYNSEYNHALKFGRDVDSDGDRVLWGHNGNVEANPELFGWSIQPF